jgi:hypothetical protein
MSYSPATVAAGIRRSGEGLADTASTNNSANVPAGQRTFLHRACWNSAAREGRYTAEREQMVDALAGGHRGIARVVLQNAATPEGRG